MSRRPSLLLPLACLALLGGASSLVGCGETDKSKIKVAEVEDHVITLAFFERKMNTMSTQYLPEDLTTREGRLELLEVMINKEVMAIKAEELGFAEDGVPDDQGRVVSEFKAAERMRADVVADAGQVSEDEIFEYYENLQRSLRISYMLFDDQEKAMEAKRLAEGGEDWFRIAERMGGGDPGPTGDYTTTMKYGTVADDVERAIYDLAVGEVSDPIDSVYGFFVARVEGQIVERVQPLDMLRPKIVASIQKQKSELAIADFIEEVFADYNFEINEEGLKLAFDALPPDAPLDPPTPNEQLKDLQLAPVHFDKTLMSWDGEVWTLGRYYEFYNESSVFGRPRREQRMGTMRRRLKEVAVRELMLRAARDRGYTDLPEIRDEFKLRREQAMVTRLHEELVKGQITVSPAEVNQWWEENPGAMSEPERRDLEGIITASEQDALAVMVAAKEPNADFLALVNEHCTDPGLRHRGGKIGRFAEGDEGFYGEVAFELDESGEVSYPRQLPDGRWVVVRVSNVLPAETPTLEEARTVIGSRLQRQKEEEAFQRRVEEWKKGLYIRRYPENLDKAVYDPSAPMPQRINIST